MERWRDSPLSPPLPSRGGHADKPIGRREVKVAITWPGPLLDTRNQTRTPRPTDVGTHAYSDTDRANTHAGYIA